MVTLKLRTIHRRPSFDSSLRVFLCVNLHAQNVKKVKQTMSYFQKPQISTYRTMSSFSCIDGGATI